MPNNYELGEAIKTRLQLFKSIPLRDASLALLKTLGYQSDKTIIVANSDPEAFLELLAEHNPDVTIDKYKALFDDWQKVDVLFQLTDEELVKAGAALKAGRANAQLLQSYLFFAIELNQQDYARGKLIAIARQLNRVFPMPVMVLIKHGELLSVAVINRRQHKRDSEKDVLGKATIIRDISLVTPHTGHIQILSSFALQNLRGINNFDALHAAWEEILNVELLSKKFYNELSNWYFWAINEVSFPGEPTAQITFKETGLNDEAKLKEAIQEHKAKNVIRLLTRFLFVWFIKEKQLIPSEFFDLDYLQKELLKDLSPYHEDGLFKSVNAQSHYYKAILQNLFFATLNQEMGKRVFRRPRQNMNVTNLLRYENCFKHPEKFIELTEKYTPFMNGGLFECLDKPNPTEKSPKGGDVIIYEDGFSDRPDNPLNVPDYLFFGHDEDVDLSYHFNSKAKKYKEAAVKGLINIFNSYKFTIAENTPVDQEIALDPELLGKVFENLLASYNPETKTTARKQTGSFYTPREIVGHMVDESLIAYLKNELEDRRVGEEALDTKLHELLSYDDSNPFEKNQSLQKKIIEALDRCKILDPACGSGAFPMGILHKMVHILQKVDPENIYWKELQMDNAVKETETVFHIDDKEAREQKLIEINEAFDQKINDPDYARKLFLIENCIYGIDIQPIATQISKLRFFISLVVDQKVDKNKDNFGIRPLPNLETKFVAANTLIGIEKNGKQLTLDNPEIKKQEAELIKVRHRMFSAKTPRTKRKLRDEDKSIRKKMGELLIDDGWVSKIANQLAGWDPYDQNASSPFFDPEWMFGASNGFDVVLGNPPYIGQKNFNYLFKEVKNSELGKFHQRRMDYFYFFIHKGLDLIKDGGHLSLITTNYFYTATYADKLRKDIYDRARFLEVIDFNEFKIFESALGQHNTVFLLKKCTDNNLKVKATVVIESGSLALRDINKILHQKVDGIYKSVLTNSQLFDSPDRYIRLYSNQDEKILDIIDSSSTGSLDDYFDLVEGIHTGADKVSKSHVLKYNLNIEVGTGIYVLSDKELSNLKLNHEETCLIKPWYKNSDIGRWCAKNTTDKNLIYYSSKEKYVDVPEIRKYLQRFKNILINRKLRSGTGIISELDYEKFVNGEKYLSYVMNASAFKKGEYYCISYPRDKRVFENDKLVVPQRSHKNTFAFNNTPFYASADVYFIRQNSSGSVSLKYVLSILNSLLVYFWLFHKGKRKGDMLELYIRPLSRIPIKVDLDFNRVLIFLSDLNIFCACNRLNTSIDFEKINDAVVFELYLAKHMKEKQIDILQFLEKDMKEVIQDRHFEKLSDSEKKVIINKLHSRWTHPDNEVRNRIKLFAVRSPDILKPILESR